MNSRKVFEYLTLLQCWWEPRPSVLSLLDSGRYVSDEILFFCHQSYIRRRRSCDFGQRGLCQESSSGEPGRGDCCPGDDNWHLLYLWRKQLHEDGEFFPTQLEGQDKEKLAKHLSSKMLWVFWSSLNIWKMCLLVPQKIFLSMSLVLSHWLRWGTTWLGWQPKNVLRQQVWGPVTLMWWSCTTASQQMSSSPTRLWSCVQRVRMQHIWPCFSNCCQDGRVARNEFLSWPSSVVAVIKVSLLHWHFRQQLINQSHSLSISPFNQHLNWSLRTETHVRAILFDCSILQLHVFSSSSSSNSHAADLCFQWWFMISNISKVNFVQRIIISRQVKLERWSTEGTTRTEVNLWSTPAVGSSLKAILWVPQVCGTAWKCTFSASSSL